MKKFFPLLLCLSLSIFTVADARKPDRTPAPDTRTAQKPTGQQADVEKLFDDANTDDETGSGDDDSMEDTSDDKGENVNNDGGGDAAGNEDTADDDGGGDEGGDDGGE